MTVVIYVAGTDGGAKRGGGVAIVPVSSSKPATAVRDSIDFNDDDADDAILSMCTDDDDDELLTSFVNDDTLMEADDQLSA